MTPPIVCTKRGPVIAQMDRADVALRLGARAINPTVNEQRPCIAIVTSSGPLFWPLIPGAEKTS